MRCPMIRPLLLLLLLASAVQATPPSFVGMRRPAACRNEPRSSDQFYVVVFGSQRIPNQAKFSHSFAAFVRVTEEQHERVLRWHTISWLPQDLDIDIFTLYSDPGFSLGLHATLQTVLTTGQRVSQWGPYRIEEELFQRSVKQMELLGSGQLRYKAVDVGYDRDRVSNCIHALSDLVNRGPRLRIARPHWGEVASFCIVRKFRPWILDDGREHPWVAEALGLGRYPMIRRNLDTTPLGFLFCRFTPFCDPCRE